MSTSDRDRRIEVIGHGGAGDFYPGNSRSSIEQALKIGVDRIEVDVQRSLDGDLVLVHNERLSVPGADDVAVRATPTTEIRRLLPGLLTLDELVDLVGSDQPLLLDVKAPGYEADLVAAIRRLDIAARTSLSSTYVRPLRTTRAAFPTIRTGLSSGHAATGIALQPARSLVAGTLARLLPLALGAGVRRAGATDVMVQYRVCSPTLVDAMHRRGIRVNAWTVDHPARIAEIIAMGVDGVISNRPDLVKEALETAEPGPD